MRLVVYAKGIHLALPGNRAGEVMVYADPSLVLTSTLLRAQLGDLPPGYRLDAELKFGPSPTPQGEPEEIPPDEPDYLKQKGKESSSVFEDEYQKRLLEFFVQAHKFFPRSDSGNALLYQLEPLRSDVYNWIADTTARNVLPHLTQTTPAHAAVNVELLAKAQEYVYHPYFIVKEVQVFVPITGLPPEEEETLERLLSFMVERNSELGYRKAVHVIRNPVDDNELNQLAESPLRILNNPDLLITLFRKRDGQQEVQLLPPSSIDAKTSLVEYHYPKWSLAELNVRTRSQHASKVPEDTVALVIKIPSPVQTPPKSSLVTPEVMIAIATSLIATAIWEGVARLWKRFSDEEEAGTHLPADRADG